MCERERAERGVRVFQSQQFGSISRKNSLSFIMRQLPGFFTWCTHRAAARESRRKSQVS